MLVCTVPLLLYISSPKAELQSYHLVLFTCKGTSTILKLHILISLHTYTVHYGTSYRTCLISWLKNVQHNPVRSFPALLCIAIPFIHCISVISIMVVQHSVWVLPRAICMEMQPSQVFPILQNTHKSTLIFFINPPRKHPTACIRTEGTWEKF